MKVTASVNLGTQDVSVHISGEDIVASFVGDEDGWTVREIMLRAVNNLAGFFKKMPDDEIAKLNFHQRKIIREFFEEQAKRF
jgi:hypothetical protein